MEYYSTIKKKELLIHATIQVNLKKVMLNRRSQTHENIYNIIPKLKNFSDRWQNSSYLGERSASIDYHSTLGKKPKITF